MEGFIIHVVVGVFGVDGVVVVVLVVISQHRDAV